MQPGILLKSGFFLARFQRIRVIFRTSILRNSSGCVHPFYLYSLFGNISHYELVSCVNQSIDLLIWIGWLVSMWCYFLLRRIYVTTFLSRLVLLICADFERWICDEVSTNNSIITVPQLWKILAERPKSAKFS